MYNGDIAGVVELVFTQVSKTCEGNLMWVRLPPPAYSMFNDGILAKEVAMAKRTLAMVLSVTLLTFTSGIADAKSPQIPVKIVSFKADGDDAFSFELEETRSDGGAERNRILVHLRFSPSRWQLKNGDKNGYLHGVNQLLDRYRTGETFVIGFEGHYPVSFTRRQQPEHQELRAVGFMIYGSDRGGRSYPMLLLESSPGEGEP